ncbi:hypothetical protein QVD17_34593 [Tagetes erecta]|uniref:Uncharacterized protein n=1 Tax=Tagetes erecta TaxID=13708 RepID=A0AAD8JYN7_TARER|nr:hypothetical protein QVD17_34593 [Tagetes erecta]
MSMRLKEVLRISFLNLFRLLKVLTFLIMLILASRHPLLVFMVLVLIWTYRTFPVLFSLLVHAFPVIASTLVLLGTLLFYGHANAPQIDQKEAKSYHHDVHNMVFGGMGNAASTDEETYGGNNMNVNDEHKRGSSVESCVSRGSKKMLTQEGYKSEMGNRKRVLVSRGGQFQGFGTGNGKLSSDGSRKNSFDPLQSVLGRMDDENKEWETGSDVVEGSSPSGSMGDMFPMLDEFHPLLESDGHLQRGEIVNETDDDDDDDDEEEENGMTWTEDDHRRLMNMGTLELERNQRLESLIARQKAIKNMRIMAEKNMVNMSPDLRFIDAHVSTGRNAPFDLPNHSHENILESAPSNMMPRRNPFDLSYDPRGGKPDHPPGHKKASTGYNERNISRRRFTKDNNSVKFHHVAKGDDRSKEIKTSGHADKTINKSNSSKFFDVPDDIHDGNDDNDNEEEEYSSMENPNSDSKDPQEDSEDSDTEEAGLPQRLGQGIRSWLTGWKA